MTKKRSSEISEDENEEIFLEKVSFPQSPKYFRKYGDLKQGEY